MIVVACRKCGKFFNYNGKDVCSDCHKASKKEYNSTSNLRRNIKIKQFRSSKAWQIMREVILARDNYQCRYCKDLATEVHHIIPLYKNFNKRLDENNLISLCKKCHETVHKHRYRGIK